MNNKTGIIILGVLGTGTIGSFIYNEFRKKNRTGIANRKGYGKYENNCIEKIKNFRYQLDTAYQQLQKGEFRYALCDANIVMKPVDHYTGCT